jgi:hypothetical protein
MHRHECNTHKFLFNLEIKQGFFSYAIFPVKKNKYWKYFKIMRKLLFNYSFYSHPEIGKFQGVTTCIKDWEVAEARLQQAVEDKELEEAFEGLFLD